MEASEKTGVEELRVKNMVFAHNYKPNVWNTYRPLVDSMLTQGAFLQKSESVH